MSHESVRRYISVFSKTDENHVRDLQFVQQPTLKVLRAVFSTGADDPMYDEYPIDARIADQLKSFIRDAFDFEHFEYFLSCDSLT